MVSVYKLFTLLYNEGCAKNNHKQVLLFYIQEETHP